MSKKWKNRCVSPIVWGSGDVIRIFTIPGSPDAETCRRRVDLDEPLSDNKTSFTLLSLGDTEINRLKSLAAALNHRLQLEKSSSIRQPIPTGTFF